MGLVARDALSGGVRRVVVRVRRSAVAPATRPGVVFTPQVRAGRTAVRVMAFQARGLAIRSVHHLPGGLLRMAARAQGPRSASRAKGVRAGITGGLVAGLAGPGGHRHVDRRPVPQARVAVRRGAGASVLPVGPGRNGCSRPDGILQVRFRRVGGGSGGDVAATLEGVRPLVAIEARGDQRRPDQSETRRRPTAYRTRAHRSNDSASDELETRVGPARGPPRRLSP